MREQADRLAARAGQDGDDVGDARREAELAAPRVGFLHPDVVSVQLQLVDDVGARARVLGRADRTAADRAGEHLHVRAGVVVAKRERRSGSIPGAP